MSKPRRPWAKLSGSGLRPLSGSGLRQLAAISTPDAARDRPGRPVYNTARWKRLSARLRSRITWCARCGRSRDDGAQLVVDHIIELRDGGAAFDLANLQVLCMPCHAKVTHARKRAREASRRPGAGPGQGGRS